MALFQRVVVYAKKASKDKLLNDPLVKEVDKLLDAVEGQLFMSHANSILESEKEKMPLQESKNNEKDIKEKLKLPLIDRLDIYYEDPGLTRRKPNLAKFPSSFHPIPCKPLLFDLAKTHISFPDLHEKMKKPGHEGHQAKTGWFGWVWGSKK